MHASATGGQIPLRIGVAGSTLSTISHVKPTSIGANHGTLKYLDSDQRLASGTFQAEGSFADPLSAISISGSLPGNKLTFSGLDSLSREKLRSFLAKPEGERLASEVTRLKGNDSITGLGMHVKAYDGDDKILIKGGKSSVVHAGIGNDLMEVIALSNGGSADLWGDEGLDTFSIGSSHSMWSENQTIRVKDYGPGDKVVIRNPRIAPAWFSSSPGQTSEGWIYFENLYFPSTRIIFEGIRDAAQLTIKWSE